MASSSRSIRSTQRTSATCPSSINCRARVWAIRVLPTPPGPLTPTMPTLSPASRACLMRSSTPRGMYTSVRGGGTPRPASVSGGGGDGCMITWSAFPTPSRTWMMSPVPVWTGPDSVRMLSPVPVCTWLSSPALGAMEGPDSGRDDGGAPFPPRPNRFLTRSAHPSTFSQKKSSRRSIAAGVA